MVMGHVLRKVAHLLIKFQDLEMLTVMNSLTLGTTEY